MVELIKFIIITMASICIVNLIMKLDKDFNAMSYIYGLIMGGLVWILYNI